MNTMDSKAAFRLQSNRIQIRSFLKSDYFWFDWKWKCPNGLWLYSDWATLLTHLTGCCGNGASAAEQASSSVACSV